LNGSLRLGLELISRRDRIARGFYFLWLHSFFGRLGWDDEMRCDAMTLGRFEVRGEVGCVRFVLGAVERSVCDGDVFCLCPDQCTCSCSSRVMSCHVMSCHVMSCHACHEVLNRVLSRSFETEPDSRSRSKGKGLDP